jgi:opacity protein-like surface antigen
MRRAVFVVLAVVSLSCFVTAQSSDGTQVSDRVEVFAGYIYVRPDFSLVSPNGGASGWNASVNFKMRPWIGMVADLSGLYPRYTLPELNGVNSVSASGSAYSYLFGPQVSMPRGRFKPFGHFLIGESHVSDENFGSQGSIQNFQSNHALSFAVGGGIDYWLKPRIAIRGQADWLYTRFTLGGVPGTNFSQNRNVARISTGIVFKF